MINERLLYRIGKINLGPKVRQDKPMRSAATMPLSSGDALSIYLLISATFFRNTYSRVMSSSPERAGCTKNLKCFLAMQHNLSLQPVSSSLGRSYQATRETRLLKRHINVKRHVRLDSNVKKNNWKKLDMTNSWTKAVQQNWRPWRLNGL